jgi:putative MATE family efflux protein
MGVEPVWPLLFRFSGPAIVSMTVASSYNLVDTIFVGRLGPTPLAAMSVTYPLILSFVAIASGTGVGATSLISRSLGTGEHRKADQAAGVAITLCFLLSGAIALTCLPNLDYLLRLFGAGDAVLPLATEYMSVIVGFTIFSYLSVILSSIIRADGNPLFSSVVMISSSLLNVALDPIFIFGLGPVRAMGISGAAWATVIAQAAGSIVYTAYIVSGRTDYRFQPRHFLPSPGVVSAIYRIGFASIARSGSQFIVMGVVNRTAASFGVIPLAVVGILVRTGRFVQMPTIGLGQGMLPLIGYNYGARKMARVVELIYKTGMASVAWTSLCWLVVMLFPAQVISVFSRDPEFLREGAQAIRVYAALYFALGVQMVPGFFFQGIGKGFPATILSTARHVLFLLPGLILLPPLFGLTGLWVAFPIADAMALLLALLWLSMELRRQGSQLKNSP